MLNDTIRVLSQVTENLPVGTNLGLLHYLWMLACGGRSIYARVCCFLAVFQLPRVSEISQAAFQSCSLQSRSIQAPHALELALLSETGILLSVSGYRA